MSGWVDVSWNNVCVIFGVIFLFILGVIWCIGW